MKRIAIIISLLNITLAFTFGQTSTDSISMKKVCGGYQFYQGNQRLNMDQLVKIIKPNEQAYKQIQSAKSTSTLASIIGFAGGFMVGWPIGAAIAGGEPNWKLAGIGAGLIVVSIPISHTCNKKTQEAVRMYNKDLKPTSFWDISELNMSINENGLGLRFNF